MRPKNKAKDQPNNNNDQKERKERNDKNDSPVDFKAGRAKVTSSGSWTGKLPATLLHEHCQKSKWEKVQFNAIHTNAGFIVNVVLSQKNTKTNEIETVQFDYPKSIISPQPTALEARHFAATYAMHRIASHKNLRMILPGPHKEIWDKLNEFKAGADKDKVDDLYSADPFQGYKNIMSKKQEAEKLKKENKEKRQEIEIKKVFRSINGNTTKVHFNNVLAMSKDARRIVEKTIRKYNGFQTTRHYAKLSDDDYDFTLSSLTKLGFEKSQVEESLSYNATISDCLEWLLIHIPENDLPELFSASKNVGFATSIQSNDLKFEYAMRQIRTYGYSDELIEDALNETKDKNLALVRLTHGLVYDIIPDSEPTSIELWSEECQSLTAIYDNCNVDDDTCTFNISTPNRDLSIMFCRSPGYPNTIPAICMAVKKVPKYVILDAIRRAGRYAVESLVGTFMIFGLTEWITENFEQVLDNPCKLLEISRGVSGSLELEMAKSEKVKPKKIPIRTGKIDTKALYKRYLAKLESAELQKMIKSRKTLPAWNKRQEIIDLVNNKQVVLITGETGSGKSTQVVQFILDDVLVSTRESCNILCTQPRRISAMGLAQRVAEERNSQVGQEVGYSIRGETKASKDTVIRFMTTGVLLRMIQSDPNALSDVSHIVVDEVHERSIDCSFLLILLRRLTKKKKNLKIILMSATIDPKLFMDYFNNDIGYTHIEGRTFPVEESYLDDVIRKLQYVPKFLEEEVSDVGRVIIALRNGIDYSLIRQLVDHIHQKIEKGGSILIFMSGAAEIDNCISELKSSSYNVLPLHASLTPAEQRRVFDSSNKRKIVVSTNVAETSITIPDVVAVIDSGRVKQTVYDPATNLVRLVDTWASRAEVTQRKGRAGRVQAGICYKLYTRTIQQSEMVAHPNAEMKRAPLDQLYLNVKAMGISDVTKFLDEALDPPKVEALDTSKYTLERLGAIDKEGKLTALGKNISMIPADLRFAKLLILSAIFGCLNTGLTIVSILSLKTPFVFPKDKREEAKNIMMKFANGFGDLMAGVQAFNEWNGVSSKRTWSKENFLSHQTLFDISSTRRQFSASLQEIGYQFESKNDNNFKLMQAIIGASLSNAEIVFPEKVFADSSSGAIEKDPDARGIRFFTMEKERVFVHPSSSLFGLNRFVNDCKFLSYATKMSTTKLYINGLTPLSIYGLVFFATDISLNPLANSNSNGIVVDNWIGLKCWTRVGILVKILGRLFNTLLENQFQNPGVEVDHELISTVVMLIDSDGMKGE